MCHDLAEMRRAFAEPVVFDRLGELKGSFRAFAARRLRDDDLVDEVVQAAFLKSLEKLHTLRDPDAAVAWFWRVLRNAVNDELRGLSTARRRASAASAEEVAAPEEEREGRACACVHGAIDSLKPDYAVVLREIELGGAAVKEWAAANGLTANNAGVRVFRARQALLKRIQHTCGSCAEGHCRDCTCAA